MADFMELIKRLTQGTKEGGPGILSPEVIGRALSPEGIGSAVRNLPGDIANADPNRLAVQKTLGSPVAQRIATGFQQGTPDPQQSLQQSASQGQLTQEEIQKVENLERNKKEDAEKAKWIQRMVKIGVPLGAAIAGSINKNFLPEAAGLSKGFVGEGQRQEEQELKREEIGLDRQKQEVTAQRELEKEATKLAQLTFSDLNPPTADQLLTARKEILDKLQGKAAVPEGFTPEQESLISETMAFFKDKSREEIIAAMKAKGQL